MSLKNAITLDGGQTLMGGLEWKPLPTKRQSPTHALRVRGKELQMTHGVFVRGQDSVPEEALPAAIAKGFKGAIQRATARRPSKKVQPFYAGGFYLDVLGNGLPKGTHSIAAAFARMRHTDLDAAVALVVRLSAEKVAVVILSNGVPVVDRVMLTDGDAYSLVTEYGKTIDGLRIVTDNPGMYPSATMVGDVLPHIIANCTAETEIKPLPLDHKKLVLLGLVALGLIAAYGGYQAWQKDLKRRYLQAQAAKDDPIPKYQQALAQQRMTLGVKREDLAAAWEPMLKVPLRPEGWVMDDGKCSVDACNLTYRRKFGTYETLLHALKPAIPDVMLDQSPPMNLEQARVSWRQAIPLSGIPADAAPPTLADFIRGEPANKLQTWLAAGLTIQAQSPELFPKVPGITETMAIPGAIRVGNFAVSNIPLPLVKEAILSAPANVVWSSLTLNPGEVRDLKNPPSKVTLTGIYYVQH